MENIYIKDELTYEANAVYEGSECYALVDIYEGNQEYIGYTKSDATKSFYWIKDAKKLRIYRIVPDSYSLEAVKTLVDFSILGFRKISPSYARGKKIKAQYKCINKDEVIVEKIFKDVRGENGILTGLEIEFNWYNEDGTIGVTKTEIVKSFNRYEAETEERKRRYRQFDYLRGSVKGTPNEPYIAIIINYFSEDITKYQDDGIMDLNQSMIDTIAMDISGLSTEQQTAIGTVQAILQAPVERNDGLGMTTVMRSIQYQIGTIPLEDL